MSMQIEDSSDESRRHGSANLMGFIGDLVMFMVSSERSPLQARILLACGTLCYSDEANKR